MAAARMEGACSNRQALLLPSVTSRAAFSRWALMRADLVPRACGEEVVEDEVVVRHTFLVVQGTPEVTPKRRATSAPPPPDSCDREADNWCALTYKPRPLDRPLAASKAKSAEISASFEAGPARQAVGEEEASLSESTATPDVDSASAAASEAGGVAEDRPGPTGFLLAEADRSLCEGDFLHRAIGANGVSEWPQSQGAPVVPTQMAACAVPRDARGLPTSIGSIGHMQGVCKPCVFAHHASKVCMNGVACPFCHFEHPPKQKRRLCRQRGV